VGPSQKRNGGTTECNWGGVLVQETLYKPLNTQEKPKRTVKEERTNGGRAPYPAIQNAIKQQRTWEENNAEGVKPLFYQFN